MPAGAAYQGGGLLLNGVVYWNVPLLGPGETEEVTFTVTASASLVNADYGVAADGGVTAQGVRVVSTTVLPDGTSCAPGKIR